MKLRMSVTVCGLGHSFMAAIFSGLVSIIDSLFTNNMSRILHFLLKEMALFGFQFQTCRLQTSKDFSQLCQMIFHRTTKNNYVINIYKTYLPLKASKYTFHEPLESCRSIGKSKGHHAELVESRSGTKDRLL